MPTGNFFAGTKNALQQLRTACSHESGDTKDFSLAQRKRNVLQPPVPGVTWPRQPEILDFENYFAGGPFSTNIHLFDFTPHHQMGDFARIRLFFQEGFHEVTVT